MEHIKLNYIIGNAPFFSNLSEVFIRPKEDSKQYIDEIGSMFTDSQVRHISLSGQIGDMIVKIQEELSFPTDTSHSVDAFADLMSDLCWVNENHLILALEFVENFTKEFYIMSDVMLRCVTLLNMERERRLSVLLLR